MLLLAVDTSQRNGSVTLARDGRALETVTVEGGMFSAQLVPRIAALLAAHNVDKQEINAFAVCTGPGSFTGLRIGLAAVLGLAEALQKPVVTVSALEALAAKAQVASGTLLAVSDAGRGEFYAGLYRPAPQTASLQRVSEELCSAVDLASLVATATAGAANFAAGKSLAALVVTAEQRIADLAEAAGGKCEIVDAPSSSDIAMLGERKLLAGQITPLESLDANYLRGDHGLFAKSK